MNGEKDALESEPNAQDRSGGSDGEVSKHEEDKERLGQWLTEMWQKQSSEIQRIDVQDSLAFKKPALPLARIKKIMKENEDVRMISGEAPLVFSKACELIISELAIYSWSKTDSSRRRTIKQGDVFECIEDNHLFDFLQMYFLDTGKMHGEGYVVEEEPLKDESTVPEATPISGAETPLRQPAAASIGYFPSSHAGGVPEQRVPLSATDSYMKDD